MPTIEELIRKRDITVELMERLRDEFKLASWIHVLQLKWLEERIDQLEGKVKHVPS